MQHIRVSDWKSKFREFIQTILSYWLNLPTCARGHVEALANVNEKLVEPLLDRLLGEDIEVEVLAGDSQFESEQVFDALNSRKISGVIPWRCLEGRENPQDVLSVKDSIDVEGPEHLRVIYKGLRAKSESLNVRVKARLAYGRLTWQGLRNACVHAALSSAWSTPSQ